MATQQPPTFALLIGVSDYSAYDPAKNLAGAAQDVARWKRVCERLGVGEITELTSPADTTGKSIERAFADLRAKLEANPGAKGVLLFAGHGDADERLPDDVYLCPSDVKKRNQSATGRIALGQLLRTLDLEPSGSSLTVVLDCCYGARAVPDGSRDDAPLSSPRLRRRSLRDTPTSARMALKRFQFENVALVTADDDVAYEAELADGWVGAFSWAATDVLCRWQRATVGVDTYFGVTHDRWMEVTRDVLDAVKIPQRPKASRGNLAAFQYLTEDARPTAIDPNGRLRGTELSGGVMGYRVYHVEVAGTVVGRILSTSYDQVPAPLDTGTEYWEVDLSKMRNKDITIRLFKDGETAVPTARAAPDRWYTKEGACVCGTTGTLPGNGGLTWRSGNGLPAFRIDSGATETVWIRDNCDPLFGDAAEDDAMNFTKSGDLAYSDKCRTEDDWNTPLPY